MTEELTAVSQTTIGEKEKLYSEILSTFAKVFSGKNDQKFLRSLTDLVRMNVYRLSVFGSDEVFHAYMKWRLIAGAKQSPEASLEAFSKLVLSMRKDLNSETTLTVEDITGAIL